MSSDNHINTFNIKADTSVRRKLSKKSRKQQTPTKENKVCLEEQIPVEMLSTKTENLQIFEKKNTHYTEQSTKKIQERYKNYTKEDVAKRFTELLSTEDKRLKELKKIHNEVKEKIRKKIQDQDQNYTQLESNIRTTESKCLFLKSFIKEMNGKVDALDNKCTGKIFVWKIKDINKKIQQSLKERVLHNSLPAYMASQSYKYCLFFHIHKYQNVKYIAVYINILKSPTDDVLEWPLKKSISLKLLNLHGLKNEERSFDCIIRDKPTEKKELKQNCGISKFITVERLDSFIFNNCIYLQCEISDWKKRYP